MDKRRLFVVSALALGIWLTTAALADEPPSMLGGVTPRQEAFFLAGAAQGISYTNASLLLSGKAQLFCAPDNFILNVAAMRFMAQQELTGPHEPETFILAALSWLEQTFPCT